MIRAKPDWSRARSRIAVRARNINMILFFLVLTVMTAIAALIIRGISEEAAMNRARAYSIEAAQVFYSYLSEDLTLVRKAAFSRAITEWSANEQDKAKRVRAFYEMMDYAALAPGAHLYLGISGSGNEYRIAGNATLEDFVPVTRLDPAAIDDAWYFKSMGSENEYTLNIGIDMFNDTWHLWINHKVFFDGDIVGIFCSGLEIPDVFYRVFGQRGNIRGYIIDKHGIIQLASAIDRIYSGGTEIHISNKSYDPAFDEVMYSYLSDIGGFFDPGSQPVGVRLFRGSYGYVSIAPIIRSDWSVVVFYNSHFMYGMSYLLPLLAVMTVALFLYVTSRNALMNRLIFTPLGRLAQSISEGKSDTSIYGSSRDDEIGELARTIRDASHEQKQMMKEIERQRNLLEAVSRMSSILLEPYIEKFGNNLSDSMGTMAQAVCADRVYIWKNHIKSGRLHCTQLYEWSGGAEPQQNTHYTVDISYDQNIPGWEETLSHGKCVNGPVRDMSAAEQAQLTPQGILSILVVPVFVRGEFWGFVGFDDCRNERVFAENEELILRSASLMIANALLRNEMALNIRDGAAKLEAVIANYPGVIWCVDQNSVITLFNGHYLYEIKTAHDFFEGKTYGDVLSGNCFQGICSGVHETFVKKEAQDFNSAFEDKMYRIRTTPIHDDSGGIASVMGSFDDITERTRLQNELKAAVEKAQAASQSKSNFLANMSHEMRTPLNAVIGLSALTLENGGLSKEAGLNLKKIHNAGATLLSTVNDILDISKIEAGRLELMPVEYDIPSLINDAIAQSILRIGEKPIKFILDIDGNLPTRLCGDDLRIKQILNNLLSNAFKYTKEGTVELSIRCNTEGDSVWMTIQVRDTGIGIRKEDLKELFSNYSQVDMQFNRRIEGTGLGLPITKKIAEMMGGSVSVESEYRKGSVFTVKLRQQFVTDAVITSSVANNLKGFRYFENKRSQNSRLARVRLPYARVLVVDDVATNLDVARGMMKPYGMQIDCVTSGQDAIDIIRAGEFKYNAIFMDHMMPVMDGIETLRIIREETGSEYAKTVPVIALTANAILGNEEMFLSKGFQDFISKPIEMARLDAVIKKWVRDKGLEQDSSPPQTGAGNSGRRFPLGTIAGLDMEKGLERFNGDTESYIQVLRSYAANSRALLKTAAKVTKDTLADYAITVHGIKGASWGICAGPVGDMAEALEKAAKEGNLGFVLSNNAAFIEDSEKLLADMEAMLDTIPAEKPKPKKDKPDTETLLKLLSACEAYEMDGVDAAMTEIESCEYEADGGLAAWLRENINKMNFAQIRERLAGLTAHNGR
ncbi:MAG: ATP-binding protein [Treponema sp.]|nr:ATP-binding protein [Treponema sp.]